MLTRVYVVVSSLCLSFRPHLQETLSEETQRKGLTTAEKMKHFGIHLGTWLISTSLAVGCGSAVYFLSQYEQGVNQMFHLSSEPFVL